MDTQKPTVKAACRLTGACPRPATVTVTVAYPARPANPELDLPARDAFVWNGEGRCDQHLQDELDLATLSGAVVVAEPISQGVTA